jgi:(p)ppGpp synthase/HD superfamily hydrolase
MITTFTVADAHAIARAAHAGQRYGDLGDYYEQHLLPIAIDLRAFGPDYEIAGILHDVIEDTRDKPDLADRYDADRLLSLGVPATEVETIVDVTRIPGESYKTMIRRIVPKPKARLVKLVDNARNLRANVDLAKTNPDLARSLTDGRYLPARRLLLTAELAGERRILA